MTRTWEVKEKSGETQKIKITREEWAGIVALGTTNSDFMEMMYAVNKSNIKEGELRSVILIAESK
jgi:hypothetical protein